MLDIVLTKKITSKVCIRFHSYFVNDSYNVLYYRRGYSDGCVPLWVIISDILHLAGSCFIVTLSDGWKVNLALHSSQKT